MGCSRQMGKVKGVTTVVCPNCEIKLGKFELRESVRIVCRDCVTWWLVTPGEYPDYEIEKYPRTDHWGNPVPNPFPEYRLFGWYGDGHGPPNWVRDELIRESAVNNDCQDNK